MINVTLKFLDFDNKPVEKEFWFHLSTADVIELEAGSEVSMVDRIKAITKGAKQNEIISIFKTMVEKSVGIRSHDGQRFIRNEQIRSEFMDSNAWGAFLIEIMQNSETMARFMNGVFPANFAQQVAEAVGEQKTKKEKKDKKKSKQASDVEALSAEYFDFPGLEGTDVKIRRDAEPTPVPQERDILDWTHYSQEELREMDDDFFDTITHPLQGKPKILLVIAMQRRNKRK